MAVRITSGRITVAALLAVAMGVASFGVERLESPSRTTAQVSGCVGGYRQREVSIPIQSTFPDEFQTPNVLPNELVEFSGGSYCKRTCDAELANNPDNGCTPGSCYMPDSCIPKNWQVQGDYDGDGDRETASYYYIFDTPTYDNEGSCSMIVKTPDPSCTSTTGGDGGTGATSSTGSTGTSSPPGTTGGGGTGTSSVPTSSAGTSSVGGMGGDGGTGTSSIPTSSAPGDTGGDGGTGANGTPTSSVATSSNPTSSAGSTGSATSSNSSSSSQGGIGGDGGTGATSSTGSNASSTASTATSSTPGGSGGDGATGTTSSSGSEGSTGSDSSTEGDTGDDGANAGDDDDDDPPVGGLCTGNECNNNGAPVCGANETCQLVANMPCLQCVPNVGGQCSATNPALPNECDVAEASGAVPPGMDCSLTANVPCVTWVGENACGNGEINLEEPTEIDEGCKVTGTASQYCMPEDLAVDDYGQFHPSHQCYQGAHCANTNGQCAWEMTSDLEQCLQENNAQDANLPEGCSCEGGRLNASCPVNYSRNPCENIPGAEFREGSWNFGVQANAGGRSPLAAQANEGEDDRCIILLDIRWCCDASGERIGWQNRACGGGWAACNAGTTENCSIPPVNCQPWTCPDGRTFPGCNAQGVPITYIQNPCNNQTPTCVKGGCFGELCVPAGTTPPTQCDIVPDAACYASAECKWQGSSCGFTMTPALQQCLNDNAGGTCPAGQSCLSACGEGQSQGGACGANDASVCCAGAITDQPVEQCDDGNQIDGDACGNDCEINCKKNADCPEGACVQGQCVNVCLAPVAANAPAGDRALHGAANAWGEFLSRLMAQQPSGNFRLLP